MSFDSPKGTHGGRQLSGPLFRWINRWAVHRLGRKGGKIMGVNALVLTTVGRTSGLGLETQVAWFPDSGGS